VGIETKTKDVVEGKKYI